MRSFTYMSDEALSAVAEELDKLPDGYPVRLSSEDAKRLMLALKAAYEHTADGGCHECGDENSEAVSEWAGGFVSGMASTLGVEFV